MHNLVYMVCGLKSGFCIKCDQLRESSGGGVGFVVPVASSRASGAGAFGNSLTHSGISLSRFPKSCRGNSTNAGLVEDRSF